VGGKEVFMGESLTSWSVGSQVSDLILYKT
jgi:hypothetical protein